LLLGPLAVDPHYWGCGVGSALMTSAITNADARGHGAILLVGDAPYYGRFGFSSEYTTQLTMPAPVLRERFLGLELRQGALLGACGMVVATGQPAMPSVVEAAELPLAA
jgi:predicted N-acetyltransferase YhbS